MRIKNHSELLGSLWVCIYFVHKNERKRITRENAAASRTFKKINIKKYL